LGVKTDGRRKTQNGNRSHARRTPYAYGRIIYARIRPRAPAPTPTPTHAYIRKATVGKL
jgi:hypothetical protein